MNTETVEENAKLLIKEVREALARGTRHYDKNGKELKTEREILTALVRDGTITFKPETQ